MHCLNDAARRKNKTDIDGRTVDLSAPAGTDEDHRTVCQEPYVTLLVDGARALARTGRWTEAAETMAQRAVASLLAEPELSFAVFQTRAGLAARELDADGPHAPSLASALAEVACLDAYAAYEVLGHTAALAILGTERASALGAVVTNAGLGAGALSADHQRALSESVALGEAGLRRLLRADTAAPGNPLNEVPQPA
ncbi:hypothetical protein MUU72_00540 [Streptomyces sp. RS10V-4]|uniref:hypothetical protein n=1 Tax=Streptomyces rhizoryzae TaxID=2932493 RepID=UPI0020066B1D|nr:hypothetical protein [Streptomyces rhizoryzae]MCK7621634.1 hypothetical protein [Streptomyces rhizoryzae]